MNYDAINNCDVIGNGELHNMPLLPEKKRCYSLENMRMPTCNRRPVVPRSSVSRWFHNMMNGGTSYRSSDISLGKTIPLYVDLQQEKESVVWVQHILDLIRRIDERRDSSHSIFLITHYVKPVFYFLFFSSPPPIIFYFSTFGRTNFLEIFQLP